MKTIISLIFIVLMGANCGYAQKLTAKERKAQREVEVIELIEIRQFAFEARSANPLSGSTVNFSSYYDLTVENMMVEAWLPYFGRVYQADYGNTDGGIKFKEEATSIEVKYEEKKKVFLIDIEVKTVNDSYKIRISTSLNGCAYVHITSNRKQAITYHGTIVPLPQLNSFND